jgi:hypothetical protein
MYMLLNSPHPVALAGNRLRLVSFSASRTMTATDCCSHFFLRSAEGSFTQSKLFQAFIDFYQ